MLAFAAPAFAVMDFNGATPKTLSADPDNAAATSGSVEICKPSNNVYGEIVSGASQFAAVTLHRNGTFEYATSSEDTKIYRNGRPDTNVGQTTIVLALTASDSSQFSGSWKAL